MSNEVGEDSCAPKRFDGFAVHVLALAGLLSLSWMGWRWAGSPHPFLFWLSVSVPIAHQFFVWHVWRGRLNGTSTITFGCYLVVFFLLFAGRFFTIVALAWVDRHSLGLPLSLRVVGTGSAMSLGAFAFLSVVLYFGMARAAGADHFDPKYRDLPLVTRGIFRWTSNGMYVYAFLLFWAIAIGFDSRAALIVAAFQHGYIWVHYFCTEKPDMKHLYGAN